MTRKRLFTLSLILLSGLFVFAFLMVYQQMQTIAFGKEWVLFSIVPHEHFPYIIWFNTTYELDFEQVRSLVASANDAAPLLPDAATLFLQLMLAIKELLRFLF